MATWKPEVNDTAKKEAQVLQPLSFRDFCSRYLSYLKNANVTTMKIGISTPTE